MIDAPIHLVGFPMDLGADRRGVDMGPSALRIAEIDTRLRSLGYKVIDEGDVPVSRPENIAVENVSLKYLDEIAAACERLADCVSGVLDEGGFPIVLGGDHSMSIGSIAGVSRYCRANEKRLGILWVDAHADLNTSSTTPSGNIHGMPVAASLGLGDPALTEVGGPSPKIVAENIVMIGLRSVDLGEKQLIRERGIRSYTMSDIDRDRMAAVIDESLAYLRERADHIHVSFDLDSIDPSWAPGVGTPVPGGLTYREAHLLMEAIASEDAVGSLEVAEANPMLDTVNKSARLAVDLVASAMGQRIL